MATLEELYSALKADGAPLPETYKEFENYMCSGPNRGYDHRKQVYESLKADGAPLPATYEEFSRALFISVGDKRRRQASAQGAASGGKAAIRGKAPGGDGFARTVGTADAASAGKAASGGQANSGKAASGGQANSGKAAEGKKPAKKADEEWKPTPLQKAVMAETVQSQVDDFVSSSDAMVENAKRVQQGMTRKGRDRRKAAKRAAQLRGLPTKVMGLSPGHGVEDPALKLKAEETALNLGAETKEWADGRSPEVYGMKMVDGELKTEWILPDGSLTTDLGDADKAEYRARRGRLQNEFVKRMTENGLDPTNKDDVEEQTRRDILSRAQKSVELRLQENEAKRKEIYDSKTERMDEAEGWDENRGFWDNFLRAFGGSVRRAMANEHPTPKPEQNLTEEDLEVRNLMSENKVLSDAKKLIESRHLKKSEGFMGGFFNLSNNFTNIKRGVADTLTDPDYYGWGIMALQQSTQLLGIEKKLKSGSRLSDSEQRLLYSAMLGNLVGENSRTPHGYNAGKITTEMLPFMVQIIANPVSGLSREMVRSFGKSGLKKIAMRKAAQGLTGEAAEKFAKKEMRKLTAKTVGLTVAGDLAESAVLANTLQGAKTASNAMERYTGNAVERKDGTIGFDGKHDWGEALYKSQASAIIENFTEMLGEHFGVIGDAVGKYSGQLIRKAGGGKVLDAVSDMVSKIGATDWARAIGEVEKKAHWNGTVNEVLEEEAGIVLNSLFTGDNKISDLWDADQQIDIVLGVGLFGGFVSGLKTVGYPVAKARAKKGLRQRDSIGSYRFGDQWTDIRDRLENAEEKDLGDVIRDLVRNEARSEEQGRAIVEYASALMRARGLNIAMSSREPEEVAMGEQQSVEESFEHGEQLVSDDDAQAMNEARMLMERMRSRLVNYTSEDFVSEKFDGEQSLRSLGELGTDDELRQAAVDYVNAKAVYDGMIQRVRDDIDLELSEAEMMIDGRVHKDSGMIEPAIMKVDDRRVYVISGRVAMFDDGSGVDLANSSDTIVIRDEDGRLEFCDPGRILRVEASLNAEEEKGVVTERIRGERARAAADKIDGVISFAPGERYAVVDKEGRERTVEVLGVPKDENGAPVAEVVDVQFFDDGSIESISISDVEAMVEAANRRRVDDFEKEREETRAEAENALPQREEEGESGLDNPNRDRSLLTDTWEMPYYGFMTTAKRYLEGERGVGGMLYVDDKGNDAIVVSAIDDNNYVGYFREYDSQGRPTNRWSAKFQNASGVRENHAVMMRTAQKLLPSGHELTEHTSVSTDGLRNLANQLKHGYELQYDEQGNVMTDLVAVNMMAKNNDLGLPQYFPGSDSNIRVSLEDKERAEVNARLANLLAPLGLDENAIHWEGDKLYVEHPVLKRSEKKEEKRGDSVVEVYDDAIVEKFGEGGIMVTPTLSPEEYEALFADNDRRRREAAGTPTDDLGQSPTENGVSSAEIVPNSEISVEGKQEERGGGTTNDSQRSGINTKSGIGEEPTEQERLSKEEATAIIAKMEFLAVADPKISLSPESWIQFFGINNSISTPMGNVKMGDGQYQKFQDMKRASEFGMAVLTLQNPDVIFIEPSEAKDGQETERDFSYVFVRSFIREGKKIKYFTSVSVLKDGMEVSVSSHISNKGKVLNKLQQFERAYTKESLLPNSSEWRLAEHPSDVPDLLPTQGKSDANLKTSAKTEPPQPNNAVSSDSSLSIDEQSGKSSIEPDGESTVSDFKDTNSATEKQVGEEESSEQGSIGYDPISKTWRNIPCEVFSNHTPDRTHTITGYPKEGDPRVSLHYNTKYKECQARIWVEDPNAETSGELIDALEKKGFDIEGGGGHAWLTADTFAEAQKIAATVKETEEEVESARQARRAERKAAEERKAQEGKEINLSEETDHNDLPLLKASDGTTTFGAIREEEGIQPGAIKLSIGFDRVVKVDGKDVHRGYGLEHIDAQRGDAIRAAGFRTVCDFVEFVSKNYTSIKKGAERNGKETYIIEVPKDDGKDTNVLYIELSADGEYWNVNSGGIFRAKYTEKKEVIEKKEKTDNSLPAIETSPATVDGKVQDTDEGGNLLSGDSSLSESSGGKGNALSAEKQGGKGESSPDGKQGEAGKDLRHDEDPALKLGAETKKGGGQERLAAGSSQEWLPTQPGREEDRVGRQRKQSRSDRQGISERKQSRSGRQRKQERSGRQRKPTRGRQTMSKRLRETIELVGNDEQAMAVLQDMEPHTMDEVAASVLSGGKVLLNDHGTSRGFMRETGYGQTEARKFIGLFARAENGGKSLRKLSEDAMSESCRDHGVVYDNGEAMNALLDVIQVCGTFGEIRQYVENKRIEEALEIFHRNERLERQELERIIWEEEHATLEDYDSWNDMLEEKYRNYDENFDAYDYNGYIADQEAAKVAAINDYEHDIRGIQEAESGRAGGVRASSEGIGDGTMGTGYGGVPEAGLQGPGALSGGGSEVLSGKGSNQGEGISADVEGSGIFKEDGIQSRGGSRGISGGTSGREGIGSEAVSQSPKAERKAESSEAETRKEKPRMASHSTEKKSKWVDEEDAEEFARLRDILRKGLGQLNMGFPPELLYAGGKMSYLMMKHGVRKFADYAMAMIEELGDAIRPHLKSLYNFTRSTEEVMESGWANELTPFEEVMSFDTLNFDKTTVDAMATAENVVKEEKSRQDIAEATLVNLLRGGGLNSTKAKNDNLGKLFAQYGQMKEKHPDALFLFRTGKNYVVLSADAEEVAKILDLPLSRFSNDGKEIPFTEFNSHSLDKYLPELARAGKRVAICEQLEDPNVTIERKYKSETSTTKPESNEKTDVQPRSEDGGRRRQQSRPDESLGAGAEHEDERTDGGRMAQRGGEHSLPDPVRGKGVSGLHQGEHDLKTESKAAGSRQKREGSENSKKNTRNNHGERGVDYAPKGEKARIEANLAAIELAKKLLGSGAEATPHEMAILRRYSGWGGLGSAFNEGNAWAPNPINKRLREILTPEEYEAAVMSRNSAYYTPAPVIDAMWDIAKALGFKGGNIVEGSAGIGNIIGLMPTDISERSNIHAVEIDNITGGILSLLYPDAKVEVQGFEKTHIGNGTVDLAITNVPFVTGLHVMDESGDSDLSKKFRDIHDFCISKNVRKLREGGIGIFITSSGTLDKSQKLRNWLVGDKEGNADVVGVFRMHNQTFGGTAATSDIIVVRKRVNGRKSTNAIDVSTVASSRTASYTDKSGKTKDLPMLINRYFIEHPEHMGGEMFFGFEQGDTYRPTSIGLFPMRTAEQSERMAAWVDELLNKDWSKEQGTSAVEQTSQINEALGEGVKEGSMLVDSEGNLCVARMGRAVPLTLNRNKIKGRTKEQCFADYKEIKGALAEVLKYQTEHEDDAGLQPLLDGLNRAYDTFVQRYGRLNKNNNLAWLRNDVDFSSIVALETYSEKGNKDGTRTRTYGKTDIFSRRVVPKESEPTPKNVRDGIIASLYKYGRIDTDYLATQLGKSKAEVRQEIVDSGLGFEDPMTGQMEVSYEYLSGNVREKLRQARESNERAGGAYDVNIKALEAVVPMNIPAHLIEFSIGSSWIEPELYEKYVRERTELDVKLTNAGGTWHMSEPWYTDKPKNNEMGVRSESLGIFIAGHKLIEAAITNKTITVSRTVKDSNGTHTESDPAATTACATKVDEIRQDFKDWAREQMQNDPDLSIRMEEIYNEQFNNSVPKTIPNDFVPEHFGGAATTIDGKPFQLRPHQAKAVIRATTQPLLLAHEVGTGKTYTLITTAMEMRRLGTARKPMIVVQNATVGQFVASAKALYPNAKVLTLEDSDRNAEGRKAFYAKIKFNDWDMIVVPQSVFERIPDSIERQTQFIQDKIEEKMLVVEQMKEADPDGRSQIVRAAEREISRLEEEITQLANGGVTPTDKKKEKDAKKAAVTRQNAEVKARELLDRATDDVEDFDSMGIDAILVDEAHEYKHLGFATAMQRGVKGVDPSPSKKSQGVFLKAQAVLEKTGGKNVVFATGTPISNTAAEIWTFMRYLMPADVMKDYGIYYFDDFVRNFGNLQQMLEFKTNGKYDEVNRFAGYVNLPELVRIWSTVADTVLTREAGGVSDKIPEMEGGKAQDIFLPQTRALRSIMKYVKDQLDVYDKMSGKEKKENSHIPLVMYGIAKAAAVDARLVQSDAEDDPNSKTNEAVRQTLRSLEETKEYNGTVAIFADNYQNKASGFNLYEDIRKKLIEAGVPEEQVIVMKPGMTVKKKLEIFDKVNAGEVRVVLGSTYTLGTGVNIQERLHTLIHLDAPNRPMDYTQRNGRILRQGNLHKTWGLPVRVLRFGVEDSLDVTAYQRLKTKGAIADSIMNGKQLMENSMENRSLEEEQDIFGDITAQLSGSEYAMLKNQIEKEVRKLRAAEKNWKADQAYIHNRKRQIAGQNREAEKRIAENNGYLEKIEGATIGNITVGKVSYPSIEAMDDFFSEQNKKKAAMQEEVRTRGYSYGPVTSDITISVGGFDFNIHTQIIRESKQGQQGDLFYSAPAKMTYSCAELGIEKMPVRGNLIKNVVTDIMENVVSGNDFRERVESAEREIERNNAELQSMSKREGVAFKDAEALAKAEEKLAEYEELMKAEMAAKEAKYAELDKDVEAASNIELTEEDSEQTVSEPIESYLERNTNFTSRYQTRDGKTVRYTSENPEAYGGLFDFDFSGENGGSEKVDNRAGADRIQWQEDNNLNKHDSGLDERAGEFSVIERVFTESGSFNFTSGEKIESAADVAFIFSALEDAAKEHSFVVLVKDGKPTVVELGMGTFNLTMVDIPTASLAYNRLRPDRVYFVHNHPSGNLKCSPQDVQTLKKIGAMSDVPVEGVIINLKTGKYGTFDTESHTDEEMKRVPASENALTVHTLDKQIFSPGYDPMEQPLVRGPEDVAKFLNSHRMGDRAKISFLIITRAGRIVGNMHTPFVEIGEDIDEMARYISERVIQFGGESAILYGDFKISSDNHGAYRKLKERLAQVGYTNLLDIVHVKGNYTKSAIEKGFLYEPMAEYETEANGIGRKFSSEEGKNYPWSRRGEMRDENGIPFVHNSQGKFEFGSIDEDVQAKTGLTPAPILLSEGMITNPKTNEGYGLIHIEARHGAQIRANGYKSVIDFIEDVANNWQIIKEGKDRNGNPTLRLIAQGKHNNTLMIELSGDGEYWNINTAGIFKSSYGKNSRELYNRHTTDKQSAETVEALQESEQSGTTDSSRMNAPITSEGKGNALLLEKQGRNAESSEQEGIRYRNDKDVYFINERFNEQLQRQVEGTLPEGHIYQIGMPGSILRAAGFPNQEIELSSKQLAKKATQRNHEFKVSDVKNLPKEIQKPIAIFRYGDGAKAENVIVGLTKNGKQFLVGVHFNQQRRGTEVLDIRGLFPKENSEWLNWISQGKALWLDKEKIQDLINQQRTNLAEVEYLDLDYVANIVENFENPALGEEISLEREGRGAYSDGELSFENDPWSKVWGESLRSKRQQKQYAERMRKAMRARVDKLSKTLGIDIDLIEDNTGLEGRKKNAKGWYDTRTGRITVVLGNNGGLEDIEVTVLHEAVGHYGLRKLFGDRFDSFLDAVYDHAEEGVKERIALLGSRNGWNRRHATEEYLAGLAEEIDFEETRYRNPSWWMKIKDLFLNFLRGCGFSVDMELSDNELRYVLWMSWKNLQEPGLYSRFLGEAERVAKEHELKVGPYSETSSDLSKASEASEEEETVEATNRRFNEELKAHIRGELPEGHVYEMGYPSKYLLSTGIENLPIKLSAKVLNFKSSMDRHQYDLSALKDLVKAIRKPWAIFSYGNKEKAQNLIIGLSDNGRQFLVGLSIHPTVKGRSLEINSIRNVFPKNNHEWINWINKGLLLRVDGKKEIQTLIDKLRMTPVAFDYLDLDEAANIVENFENPATGEENILFRDGDYTAHDRVVASDYYERMLSRGSWQYREAMQDSMLGLRTLYEAILTEGDKGRRRSFRIEDIAGYENAYLYENRMSSANNGEQHQYFSRYMQPLLESIFELCGRDETERRMLTDYMMAKHGLERNEYMRNEAIAAGEESARDFAGLCGLTGEADWKLAEAAAQQMVDDYESDHKTDELWDRVKKATGATLEKLYLSGLISEETYSKVEGMYDHYIPLRGWEATTSDEVYGYLTSKDGPLMGNVMKKAEGRSSKADDPIATIAMMADDAIRQGNRNIMKQRFLNFVHGHPSDLVSVNELWLHYDDVRDEWEAVFADLESDMSREEVEKEIRLFEEKMKVLAEAEPDKYKRGRDARHIPYKVVGRNMNEHQVLVKRNGRTYVMTINGNPRAAQALNGLTNPDVETGGVIGNMLKAGEWINRNLSAFYTTRNPDFVMSNFMRDMLYSNVMTWVKEPPRYALQFHRNFGRVNPARLRYLLSKWERGELSEGVYMERMFREFMLNGGETGYTSVKDIEGHKRTIAAELRKQGSAGRKAWAALGSQLDLLNRSVENCARFAAFMTSREMGRSLDRSIYDAKEVSVNFNKKGSGGKFVNATGQTFLGKVGSYMGGGGRIAYVFWNAGVQGMTNFGRAGLRNPRKALAGAAAMFALGTVVPLLAQMLGGGDGGDDDKNAYYNLPEYVRRSNLCFKAGDQWITIPLPIEFRAIYGLGELSTGVVSGNERYSDSELIRQMMSQVSQIMPLDVLEGGGGISPFIPSALKPMTEAYIMNKGWTGLPIYKDSHFNRNDPEWTKAYRSADQTLVGFTRWLNETTGGDDYKKGAIDINPAKVEYLLNGTLGGMMTLPMNTKKSVETMIGNREFDWRNVPLANRVVKNGDERTANRKLINEYFKYKAEAEETNRLRRKYENAKEAGLWNYARKIDLLYNSEEYGRFLVYDHYRKEIEALGDSVKMATGAERADKEAEYYRKLREMVDSIRRPEAMIEELTGKGASMKKAQ